MLIKSISLQRFKKIEAAEIDMHSINVLIGGNNSGKSSVLQGIHFSVVAAVASRRVGKQTFTQDNLLFCPTRNFVTLRNGLPYQNQSNFGYLRIFADTPEGDEVSYEIRVYRGRNEGNVGCERTGNPAFGTIITNSIPPFSIYVPGLAGIPQIEEFRSESVVRMGAASGDANLYLRNVIYLIKQKDLTVELVRLMEKIFPGFSITVRFDQVHDSYLDVLVSEGRFKPSKLLELTGTGILQALQIFSYVTLFKPKLLLLDEPDAHLHPDNQSLLAQALLTISNETDTKIIISTHSRHMVDALYGDANFIWLKDGKVFEQGESIRRLSLLMDIGALDSFEKLREGEINCVVLSEDRSPVMMRTLLTAVGFDTNEVLIYSYKSSSNLNAAGALAEFIHEIAPETDIIIHTDNDFFTTEEIINLSARINEFGGYPFITEGSDIESYFTNPRHLSELLDVGVDEIEVWLAELATQAHNKLTHKYSRKRDDAKYKLYRRNPEDAPDTLLLMGNAVPLGPEKRLGKIMLAAIRANMSGKFDKDIDPIQTTLGLESPRLLQIKEEIDN